MGRRRLARSVTFPASEQPDERALQVALRAARRQLAQRNERLARLVVHLQRAADAPEVTARAAADRADADRADAVATELAALRASRTDRWLTAARKVTRALGGGPRHR